MKLKDSDLDNLIKKNIEKRGVLGDISVAELQNIKEKIKKELLDKKNEVVNSIYAQENIDEAVPPTADAPVNIAAEIPAGAVSNNLTNIGVNNTASNPIENSEANPITQSTTTNPEEIELAKKEGEISQREKELNDREIALANKEAELQRKEDELKYNPILPAFLENVGKEEFFIFNTDDISKGAEALSNAEFHLKNSPDKKETMQNIWASAGKREADMFLVKFEKIGELKFDPFNGTTTFTENKEEYTPVSIPLDKGMTPEDALASQMPGEGMLDAVMPKTSSIEDAMPADDYKNFAPDFDNYVKERMAAVVQDYLKRYPKV